MNKEQILEQLRNDDEYYYGVGTQFISNSDIGTLLHNPRMFKVPSQKTPQMLQGNYFHTAILEPEKLKHFVLVDASTRNTNIYKDAIKEHNADYLMLKSEADELEKSVEVLKQNKFLYSLVRANGNQFEVPFVGFIDGIPFKCKVDIHNPESKNYDLKTTSSIDDFKYSCKKYNYDSQCWIYKQLTGLDMEFIVIEKNSGRLGHFIPTYDFYESGMQKVFKALENYKKFFASDATEDVTQFYTEGYLF